MCSQCALCVCRTRPWVGLLCSAASSKACAHAQACARILSNVMIMSHRHFAGSGFLIFPRHPGLTLPRSTACFSLSIYFCRSATCDSRARPIDFKHPPWRHKPTRSRLPPRHTGASGSAAGERPARIVGGGGVRGEGLGGWWELLRGGAWG